MTEKEVFKRLESSTKIRSIPQVLAEVLRAVDSINYPSKKLATVISSDPTLAARLLRLVNSSFYGFRDPISTITHAINLIGIREVKALALSMTLYQSFDEETIIVDRKPFWRHSLETAIACREIAAECNYKPEEEAFLVGLLHDLGLLALEAGFPKEFKQVWDKVKDGEELILAEQSLLGTNHARVCQFLMDKWNLPSFIGQAIVQHHNDFTIGEQIPQDRLGCILGLSNLISKFRIDGEYSYDDKSIESIDTLSNSLNISSNALIEIHSKALNTMHEQSKFLDMPIGTETELLKKANRLLAEQYHLAEEMLYLNRKMHEQIAREKLKEREIEALKTITATLSHHINNTTPHIMSGAQRVQSAINKGRIIDKENIAFDYTELAIQSAERIAKFLEVLKRFSRFDTIRYTSETSILDIDNRLKEELERIDMETKPT